jgi:hypothetical protein
MALTVITGEMIVRTRASQWNEKALVVVWSEAGETFTFTRDDVKHAGFLLTFGLQNDTNKDITVPTDVAIMKRLIRGHTLTEYAGVKLNQPFFVPAHQRAELTIWLDRGCRIEDLATGGETQRDPQICFNEEFADTDALVLFDHHERIQINLPKPTLKLK